MKHMQMRITWILSGLVAGVFAASMFTTVRAGPLDPPPGPVTSTSPSLADLGVKLDALNASVASSASFPPGLQVEAVPPYSGTADALVGVTGKVRIYAITCGQGQYTLTEKASGRNIAFMTAAVLRNGDNEAFNANELLLGGLEVQPPLRLNSAGINVGTIAHIYYWPSSP